MITIYGEGNHAARGSLARAVRDGRDCQNVTYICSRRLGLRNRDTSLNPEFRES